ncbi:MAG: SurA N-terminal domain-containing protein [Balneolaceae bacterium]
MRNSTPAILWVLIFSFGILWVLQDTQVFDAMAGGPTDMGSVNGERITLEEFNSRVSYYLEQYNQETEAPMQGDMRARFEEQAWNDLVTEKLMAQRMAQLGIRVTDQELLNMVTGENPDPFIRQQFEDETGRIDQIALRAAIEAPENQEVWLAIEQQLRQNRQQQKLANYITSGMKVTSRDVERAWQQENSFADIRFVRVPYNSIDASGIEISDGEVRDFYNDNRDLFHRDESYRFEYVAFEKVPTAEDTSRTIQDVEELRERFIEAEDHQSFLQQVQSAIPFNDSFVSPDDIREEFAPVLELEPGEVSDLVMINGDPYLFKKVAEEDGRIQFAILTYRVIPDPIATVDQLAEQADEFQYFALEEGFREEAGNQGLQVSSASAVQGTPFVPALGPAQELIRELSTLSRGEISEVVELSNQFVIARLVERIAEGPRPLEEVRGQIESRIREQKRREQTVLHVQDQLPQDVTLVSAAEALNVEVQSAESVRMGGQAIPGAGREPGIIGSAFSLQPGETSALLEGESGLYLVELLELDMADPANMSQEDRSRVRQNLEQQKFAAYNSVWIEELRESATIRDNRNRFLSQ